MRRRVVAVGRVQNVGFRESCRREAAIRGVVGYVRNRSDGAVEAEFEGDEGAVVGMVAWCRVGPRLARVERLDIIDMATAGDTAFEVR